MRSGVQRYTSCLAKKALATKYRRVRVRLESAGVVVAAVAVSLVVLSSGCVVYPVLLPPEAARPGTLEVGGFFAAGGQDDHTGGVLADVAPGVMDVGAQARLGLLPGVEVGARGSLGGGCLADVRLQPLRRPVSLSLDLAGFQNHFLGAWNDPHVSQSITYRGVRPSLIVGIGRFYGGVAYTKAYAWGTGYGVGMELYDTFDIRTAIAGVSLGTELRLLVEAELFKVRSRWMNEYGLCVGFAGYSPPIRLWGRRRPD